MPHVVVKMWAGKTEAQKQALAQAMVEALKAAVGSSDSSISVAIEDVAPEQWMQQVYEPEIAPRLESLYKKPGYGPAA
ncbi:tautomerase family protein [Ideonella sp. YS5]|uniref:tautomerase family protein n=1 Tax=Ideonella sp. YS5 TaxID=3453714 RepID=UPI003EED4805